MPRRPPSRRRNPEPAVGSRPLPHEVALDIAQHVIHRIERDGGKAAIAGGLAMQLHGFTRNTADIDIVSDRDLPLGTRVGALSIGGTSYRLAHAWGDVDVDLIVRDDGEADLHLEATESPSFKHDLPVLHPNYLAIMKSTAMRSKDGIDCDYLYRNKLVSFAAIKRILERHFGAGADYILRDMRQDAQLALWRDREERKRNR